MTGIPDFAHRWATDDGWPKKSAICCQPFSEPDSFFCLGMKGASPYSFFDVQSSFRAANEILYTLPEFHKPSDEDWMITDAPPRKANHRAGFLESDRIKTLDLPQDGRLLTIAQSIESAMKSGTTVDVRRACAEFLDAASEFYRVPACGIRVLASRPLRVRENWSTELFGD
jgi:hypothetical protein